MKALPLQPTKLFTNAAICDADWSVCESFLFAVRLQHLRVWLSVTMTVKLTLVGLWHTPAASLGSRLCDTGLPAPVRAGCVLVGGAGR